MADRADTMFLRAIASTLLFTMSALVLGVAAQIMLSFGVTTEVTFFGSIRYDVAPIGMAGIVTAVIGAVLLLAGIMNGWSLYSDAVRLARSERKQRSGGGDII